MSAARGYYSVIQYCPDRSRMEAANIGVLLICPEHGFVKVRTAPTNARITKFFRGESIDLALVDSSKRAIEWRVEVDRDNFRTPEDLVRFMDTRGNDIILIPPRPMKVSDPERDIDALFDDLVGGWAKQQKERTLIPALDAVFHRPTLDGRVLFDIPVVIPILDKRFKVPYAYKNGVLNLVKPQRFASGKKQAVDSVTMSLAIQGDLLQGSSVQSEPKKLIVVSAFSGSASTDGLRDRVDKVLKKYNVRVVHEDRIEEFAAEVEQQAHGLAE